MKRKIALCLSGQMRSYKTCYPSLKKFLLDKFKPDVFIHTWDKTGVTQHMHRIFGLKSEKDLKYKVKEEIVTEEVLKKLYNPKKVVIERFLPKYTDVLDNIRVPEILKVKEPDNYKGSLPMFYKIKMCNNLKVEYEKEKNFKYDIVIRMRPDIVLEDYIPLEVILSNNTFWRPTFVHGKLPGKFITDQFAISDSDIMDYYSSVFDLLRFYWKDPLGNKDELLKCGFSEEEIDMYPFKLSHRVGERLMTYHMLRKEIEIRDLNIPFRIQRAKVKGLQVYKIKVLNKIKHLLFNQINL